MPSTSLSEEAHDISLYPNLNRTMHSVDDFVALSHFRSKHEQQIPSNPSGGHYKGRWDRKYKSDSFKAMGVGEIRGWI